MAEHAHSTSPNRPPATVITSRRIAVTTALLSLSGAAVARPAIRTTGVVAKFGENPDAALLELGRQLNAAQANVDARLAANTHITDDDIEVLMEPCYKAVNQIEHIPAHTLEGVLVKARAISWCNDGAEIDPDRFCPYPGCTTDGRIAASIVRDLLRRA